MFCVLLRSAGTAYRLFQDSRHWGTTRSRAVEKDQCLDTLIERTTHSWGHDPRFTKGPRWGSEIKGTNLAGRCCVHLYHRNPGTQQQKVYDGEKARKSKFKLILRREWERQESRGTSPRRQRPRLALDLRHSYLTSGFWGSLASLSLYLIRIIITPGSLAPPISMVSHYGAWNVARPIILHNSSFLPITAELAQSQELGRLTSGF